MLSVGNTSTIELDRVSASPKDGKARRSVASLTGTQSWSDRAAEFTASVRVQDGTVLLLIEGRLDSETLRTCHLALAAALRVRTRQVIVDVSRAKLDHRSIDPLAHLICLAGRFGAVLLLRDLPVRLRTDLARAAPASHYRLDCAVVGRSPRLPDPRAGLSDPRAGSVDDVTGSSDNGMISLQPEVPARNQLR